MRKLVQQLLGVLVLLYLTYSVQIAMCLVMLTYPLFRPFSQGLVVRLGCMIQGRYIEQMVFFMEKVLNIQMRFTGEFPSDAEGALVISNHLTHDWAPMYCFGYRLGTLGYVRTVIKRIVSYFPGFGWGMTLLYWPFVSRDFAKDEKYLKKLFSVYKNNNLPVQLWLFPEGTRLTQKKLKSSQEYAKEKGYPIWNNLLLPRHKGFNTTLSSLDGVVSVIYNVTLSYEGWPGNRAPSLGQIIVGDRSKRHVMHLHLERIPVKDVPRDEEGRKAWLMKIFDEKDKLLDHWKQHGQFPGKEFPRTYPLSDILPCFLTWAAVNISVAYVVITWILF
jgi:lysocardiolipin and lysophospholipid acyltransferase